LMFHHAVDHSFGDGVDQPGDQGDDDSGQNRSNEIGRKKGIQVQVLPSPFRLTGRRDYFPIFGPRGISWASIHIAMFVIVKMVSVLLVRGYPLNDLNFYISSSRRRVQSLSTHTVTLVFFSSDVEVYVSSLLNCSGMVEVFSLLNADNRSYNLGCSASK